MTQPMSQKDRAEWVQTGVWGLGFIACAFAVLAWGQGLHWSFARFSAYKLFPLFGLLAFSLMWTHYIAGSVRRIAGLDKSVIKPYLRITGWMVLILICLHPGLLIFQLYRDGFGLPPSSYLNNYVAPNMEWAALLGTASFLVFLAYEAKRWFGRKSWWKFVVYAGDVAMLAILLHGLRLGRNLQMGWFRSVWIVYAITYVAALIYNYWYDAHSAPSQAKLP